MVQGIGLRGGGQAEGDGVGVGAVPRADPASIAPESSPGTDGAHGRWATGCWGGASAVASPMPEPGEYVELHPLPNGGVLALGQSRDHYLQ